MLVGETRVFLMMVSFSKMFLRSEARQELKITAMDIRNYRQCTCYNRETLMSQYGYSAINAGTSHTKAIVYSVSFWLSKETAPCNAYFFPLFVFYKRVL
jgi:hypothetical protein